MKKKHNEQRGNRISGSRKTKDGKEWATQIDEEEEEAPRASHPALSSLISFSSRVLLARSWLDYIRELIALGLPSAECAFSFFLSFPSLSNIVASFRLVYLVSSLSGCSLESRQRNDQVYTEIREDCWSTEGRHAQHIGSNNDDAQNGWKSRSDRTSRTRLLPSVGINRRWTGIGGKEDERRDIIFKMVDSGALAKLIMRLFLFIIHKRWSELSLFPRSLRGWGVWKIAASLHQCDSSVFSQIPSPLLFLFFLFTRPWWCRQRAKGIEPSRAILESHLQFFFFFRLKPNRKRERKKIFLLKGSDWLDIGWILSVASAASVVVYIYFPWMDRTAPQRFGFLGFGRKWDGPTSLSALLLSTSSASRTTSRTPSIAPSRLVGWLSTWKSLSYFPVPRRPGRQAAGRLFSIGRHVLIEKTRARASTANKTKNNKK